MNDKNRPIQTVCECSQMINYHLSEHKTDSNEWELGSFRLARVGLFGLPLRHGTGSKRFTAIVIRANPGIYG